MLSDITGVADKDWHRTVFMPNVSLCARYWRSFEHKLTFDSCEGGN
jgi:hypothetical protein